MRNNTLYFLRAIPGTGKSTFIRENNLVPFTISMDTIREMISGISINSENELRLSQQRNAEVFGLFKDLLIRRMKHGGPIVIDNYYSGKSTYKKLVNLAISHGYDSKIVDFPVLELDESIKRNKERDEYKRIGEERTKEMFYSFQDALLGGDSIESLSQEEALSEINISIDDLTVNLNNYKKIHHIGDLQGTYNPIRDYISEHGLNDDEFYIFLGDYIDRGIQNREAIDFVLSLKNKDNVVFLKGNHEIHLHNYAFGLDVRSKEFNENTIHQIKRGEFKKGELRNFVLSLKDFYAYEYDGKKVFCNHAGIGTVPEKPRLVSPMMYLKGQSNYNYDIDSHFDKHAPLGWYQMHGHRNFSEETFYDQSVDVNRRSFSLESNVEYGGKLSVMQLDKSGFKIVKVKAELLKRKDEYYVENSKIKVQKEKDEYYVENSKIKEQKEKDEFIKKLKEHSFVREKIMVSRPHISSYNFTEEAFFNKEFDDINTKARGLFVNNKTNEIVARGYDKFFNVGERDIESASIESIKNNMKGEISTFLKENGFLGILGYDSFSDDLLFASKSTCDGDFSKYFKDIFEETVSKEDAERIKNQFKKNNLCAVFEVNDPENDPHIVEYKTPHIVILDIFKREITLKRLSYKNLEKFSEKFKIPLKAVGPKFDNVSKFIDFNNKVSNESPLTTKNKIEGFVAEDEDGRMIKIKLPYYNYWKQMRSLAHVIKKHKLKIEEKNRKIDNKIKDCLENEKIPSEKKDNIIELLNKNKASLEDDFIDNKIKNSFFIKESEYSDAKMFLNYLLKLDASNLSSDIVFLRNEFNKSRNSAPKKSFKL